MGADVHFPAMTDGREIIKKSTLDGQGLKILVEAGLTWLKANQQLVNSLNVFPVPDGPTIAVVLPFSKVIETSLIVIERPL